MIMISTFSFNRKFDHLKLKLSKPKENRECKKKYQLINDWSAILLCLPCIIFHEYMRIFPVCGFLLFTEFWCFATRFSGCYEI